MRPRMVYSILGVLLFTVLSACATPAAPTETAQMETRPILSSPLAVATEPPVASATRTPILLPTNTPAPTTPPTPSPLPLPTMPVSPSGCLAFHSYRAGNNDIYTIRPDGTGLVQLTTDPADDHNAIWSPDGQQLAFLSRRDGNLEIYLMQADGTNQRNLTNHPGADSWPAWSPDGSRLAFISSRDGEWSDRDIYIIQTDGSGLVRVTDDQEYKTWLSWSPDGTRLLFQAGIQEKSTISIAHVDGSGVERITSGEDPAWSPDGEQIAFADIRDNRSSIFRLTLQDNRLQRLTDYFTAGDSAPVWSPDGRLIAFSRTLFSEMRRYSYGVFTVPADGSDVAVRIAEVKTITPSLADWSPDGAYLVFSYPPGLATAETTDGEIIVVRFDGSEQTRVTRGKIAPKWCP